MLNHSIDFATPPALKLGISIHSFRIGTHIILHSRYVSGPKGIVQNGTTRPMQTASKQCLVNLLIGDEHKNKKARIIKMF